MTISINIQSTIISRLRWNNLMLNDFGEFHIAVAFMEADLFFLFFLWKQRMKQKINKRFVHASRPF